MRIPPTCDEPIRAINKVVARYDASVEFDGSIGSAEVPVKISKEKPIPIREKAVLTYSTTIYGKVIQVGGAKPNVHIKPLSGESQVICDLSEDQAKKSAALLYDTVCVSGVAKEEDGAITRMQVVDILPFRGGEGTNPLKNFSDLLEGETLVHDDSDRFMHMVRGSEDEDG